MATALAADVYRCIGVTERQQQTACEWLDRSTAVGSINWGEWNCCRCRCSRPPPAIRRPMACRRCCRRRCCRAAAASLLGDRIQVGGQAGEAGAQRPRVVRLPHAGHQLDRRRQRRAVRLVAACRPSPNCSLKIHISRPVRCESDSTRCCWTSASANDTACCMLMPSPASSQPLMPGKRWMPAILVEGGP